jgi:hypothetical protein
VVIGLCHGPINKDCLLRGQLSLSTHYYRIDFAWQYTLINGGGLAGQPPPLIGGRAAGSVTALVNV